MKIQLCLSFLCLFTLKAYSGERGHGGDPLALEFTIASLIATDYASISTGDLITSEELNILKSSIENTKVFVTDHKLCRDGNCDGGVEFVAMNFPNQGKIEINRAKWSSLSWDKKLLISLHEHLGVVGLEQDNYFYSSKLLIKRALRTPSDLQIYKVDKLTLTVKKEIFIPARTKSFGVSIDKFGKTKIVYQNFDSGCSFELTDMKDEPRVLRLGRKIEFIRRYGGLSENDSGYTEFSFSIDSIYGGNGNGKWDYTDKAIKKMRCYTPSSQPFEALKTDYFEVDAWQAPVSDA